MMDREPPVSPLTCYCRCHLEPDGPAVGADRRDPIAAAAACERCRGHHCLALEDPPRPPAPRPDPTAWQDPA